MTNKLTRVLSLKDLTLFTVSAIILLDTLAASASVGVSSIFWWLFLGVIFMLPMGLMTAELGTAIPAEGGIYAWIKRAFGDRWAARASWSYWINTAIWLPSIFVLFSGVLSQLYGLELSLREQIFIGIILAWTTVALDVLGLDISKWVPDIGALLKLVIFAALIIGGVRYAWMNGMASDFNWQSIKPTWTDGTKYLPAIIYGMLGFELVSAAGGEIQNPRRNVPIAILISGLLILFLYTGATAGILAAIPPGELDIVEGLVDTLFLLFGDIPGGEIFVKILGTAALFTFFSNGATWAMGCNRAAAEAAHDGQLPGAWGWKREGSSSPIGAAMMMGLVMTVALLIYGKLAGSNEELFWSLFSFSAVIFMLPYVGLSLSFIKLRFNEPDLARPFKVAGGIVGACIIGGTTTLVLLASIALFIYVPDHGPRPTTLYELSVAIWSGKFLNTAILTGLVVALSVGELLVILAAKQHIRRE